MGAAVIVVAIVAGSLAFSQIRGDAGESKRALPAGFVASGAPNVVANVYIYAAFKDPRSLPLSAVGGKPGEEESAVSVEAAVVDPEGDYAARFILTDENGARRAAAAGAERWASKDAYAYFTSRESAWSRAIQGAWDAGDRTTFAEWDAAVWDAIQLLPERPPTAPFAAGFARSPWSVAERLLIDARVETPGIGAGLTFLRVGPVAFAVYGDPVPLPANLGDTLLQPGVSALAVGRSGYPGLVAESLVGAFVSARGMERIAIDDEDAYVIALPNGMSFIVKAYGADLYFGVAADQESAEALIRSVIADRR